MAASHVTFDMRSSKPRIARKVSNPRRIDIADFLPMEKPGMQSFVARYVSGCIADENGKIRPGWLVYPVVNPVTFSVGTHHIPKYEVDLRRFSAKSEQGETGLGRK